MKFPYGNCDFYDIITEQYFYVDRTDHIPLIEKAGKYLLFLRPRRFGKSLLLSMLQNYYDVAKADDFERLFGQLAIGKDPTPLHNQYFILKWDFSAVSPARDIQQVQQTLYNHINGSIEQFKVHYQNMLDYEILLEPTDALRSFQSVLAAVQRTPYKLYLLIDEYDNFANEVMMGSQDFQADRYKALVYGEGCLKAIFKAVKAATAGVGLDRAFIAGVSPVVMSDMTSGHNIAEDISLVPQFNDLCGFWEAEITPPLTTLVEEGQLPTEKTTEALELIRTFYNGYCFTDAPEQESDTETAPDRRLYNPTLVLYFLKQFQTRGHYPREVLDSNFAMDRQKITYISRIPGGDQVIQQAVDEAHPLSVEHLAYRFGVEDMLYGDKDQTFMVSLLYYFGVLTMDGTTPLGKFLLTIPNLVVRRLYVEQIQSLFLPNLQKDEAMRAAEVFYSTGDIQPLCEFIEQRYFKVFDNRDYRWTNELTVKTAFLTLLFHDTFYIMDSEPSLERGYADLIMIVRPDMRQYQLLDLLLEFKYLSLQVVGLSGEAVKSLSHEEIIALSPVQAAMKEAKEQLIGYCRTLQTAYGDMLRLRVYSVVAIGFERLVWEEVGKN